MICCLYIQHTSQESDIFMNTCSVEKHFLSSRHPWCCAWAFSKAVPAASALMSAAHRHSNRLSRHCCHLSLSPFPLLIHYSTLVWRSSVFQGQKIKLCFIQSPFSGFWTPHLIPQSGIFIAPSQCPINQFYHVCPSYYNGAKKSILAF